VFLYLPMLVVVLLAGRGAEAGDAIEASPAL
jgi:hypothetical protein